MGKTRSLLTAAMATTAAWATQSMGQHPVVASFQANGQLTWTNTVDNSAVYSLEWASSASGPWHRFTYQPINTIDAHTNTSFRVEVPMFYRVVMATIPPPRGMVWIDGGDVELGMVPTSMYVHTNFISGFWMDAMEVTKMQWNDVAAWAATNAYDIATTNGLGKAGNHPVQSVSWYECIKWCNARSEKEGLKPFYFLNKSTSIVYRSGGGAGWPPTVRWNASGYRLPTEAEWEKAARGGHQRRLFPWGGDTIQHQWANYYAVESGPFPYDTSPTIGYHPSFNTGNQPYTSPVGSFPANGYGLYDMAGNVSEWCWDRYADYPDGYATDPRGPDTGAFRLVRGGSWNQKADKHRCVNRVGTHYELDSDIEIGFRCVRGP